ncbi:MAG: hypothetical protein KC636_24630, partial [Myxococcales bacterium]|nr:hypothetical protein [Myxococcales bacterium]
MARRPGRRGVWWTSALVSGLTSSCFTGQFASGRACTRDADCGPQLACVEGFCGGPPATTTDDDVTTTTTGTDTTTTTTSDGSDSDSQTGTTAELEPCQLLDILLVLDNSDSMNQWDFALLQLASLFKDAIETGLTDVASLHFGVITTDAHDGNPEQCRQVGALALNNDLLTCKKWAERPYLTEQDSFDIETLQCFVALQSGSDDEQPMTALLNATSPEFNGPGGCNEGFLRDGSMLAVIIMTDEDDDHVASDPQGNAGSPGDPQFWYDKLLYHRGGNRNGIVLGALLGDENQAASSCAWDLPDDLNEEGPVGAEAGTRIRGFLTKFPLTGHFESSICAASFVEFFTEFFTSVVVDACEDFAPGDTTGGDDPTVGDPTDATTTGPDTDTDTDTDTITPGTETDTGGPIVEPNPGESCDPQQELYGAKPFCWTKGYGEIGQVYRCDDMTNQWLLDTGNACCGGAIGCSGNGVLDEASACVCVDGDGCSNTGCLDDGQALFCVNDIQYRADCVSGCLSDPNDATKAICG